MCSSATPSSKHLSTRDLRILLTNATHTKDKSRIVEEGNYHKFTSSEPQLQLKRKLLETGERELVEASPTDRIWGVGFGADDAEENRKDWGENLLGKAIAAVRERLRRE
ncbi:hypothetical protein LTR50_002013 [Elasticomyces elasticus]|nr:hypothetical protein LTR50_002013 [Elasticomyces elasticus]